MRYYCEIYSKPDCPYCEKAIELVKQNEDILILEEKKITNDAKGKHTKEMLFSTVSNWKDGVVPTTVPIIFVDWHHIGGYKELIQTIEDLRNAKTED